MTISKFRCGTRILMAGLLMAGQAVSGVEFPDSVMISKSQRSAAATGIFRLHAAPQGAISKVTSPCSISMPGTPLISGGTSPLIAFPSLNRRSPLREFRILPKSIRKTV